MGREPELNIRQRVKWARPFGIENGARSIATCHDTIVALNLVPEPYYTTAELQKDESDNFFKW